MLNNHQATIESLNLIIQMFVCFCFQSALFDVFCPCVPSHKRPGHGGHARTRSAHPDVQPRSLNLGVLFRTSNNPPNATPISFDGDVVTPGADPSLNGTIVVTSSYVETRFVSPPNGSRHQLQIHSPEANNVSVCLKLFISFYNGTYLLYHQP
jgi:hypothetical protein